MITYLTTSIFDSPAQTLVNPVNTVGVMGAGLAKEFKQRYPGMFLAYKEMCRDKTLCVGMPMLWQGYEKSVLLFPTKGDWRDASTFAFIEAGLVSFSESIWWSDGSTTLAIPSIAYPQLGCGLGGLKWSDVKPLMERYLSDLPIPVYIHLTTKA